MVEFVEGSGFYPPTLNSFSANANSDFFMGNETVKVTITADDRVELSSLAMDHLFEV